VLSAAQKSWSSSARERPPTLPASCRPLRLRESLIERLAGVAGGPLYLLIEVALERLITELEKSKGVQAIDAKSLKD